MASSAVGREWRPDPRNQLLFTRRVAIKCPSTIPYYDQPDGPSNFTPLTGTGTSDACNELTLALLKASASSDSVHPLSEADAIRREQKEAASFETA